MSHSMLWPQGSLNSLCVSMTLATEGESEMTEEVQAGAGSEEEGKSRGAFQGIFRHLRFGERFWPISIPK